MIDEPIAALPVALNVSTLDCVVGFVEYETVTPLGRPDTDKVTLPVNPAAGLTVIVLEAVVVCLRATLLGEAESEKPGGLMVRYSVLVAVKLPDVPVMVIVGVPGAAALVVESVNVLLPVVGFGENDAVTPLGNPEAAKVTAPVNPY